MVVPFLMSVTNLSLTLRVYRAATCFGARLTSFDSLQMQLHVDETILKSRWTIQGVCLFIFLTVGWKKCFKSTHVHVDKALLAVVPVLPAAAGSCFQWKSSLIKTLLIWLTMDNLEPLKTEISSWSRYRTIQNSRWVKSERFGHVYISEGLYVF